MESPVASFVYKPATQPAEPRTSFEFPRAGQPVSGLTSLFVKSDVPGAELCVLEYSFGSDSARRDWQLIGCFPKAQELFEGMWASDSALIRAGKPYESPCVLRATVMGRQGQHEEVVSATIVSEPPKRDTRGCGCH